MKPAGARSQGQLNPLHEQWRRNRAAAQTLSAAFPKVESIQLELQFAEQTARAPVSQRYVLHQAASAFFEYCCPHSDCDGRFDLSDAVRYLNTNNARQFEGSVDCDGKRLKDATGRQPCRLRLNYVVGIEYSQS